MTAWTLMPQQRSRLSARAKCEALALGGAASAQEKLAVHAEIDLTCKGGIEGRRRKLTSLVIAAALDVEVAGLGATEQLRVWRLSEWIVVEEIKLERIEGPLACPQQELGKRIDLIVVSSGREAEQFALERFKPRRCRRQEEIAGLYDR